MRTILFRGNTSRKRLNLYHHRGSEAEVTPYIITEDAKDCLGEDVVRMGLLLQCTPLVSLGEADEDASLELFEEFNGHEAMCNPVLWWRALLFVEAMPIIGEMFHVELYWGAGRHEPESYFQREVNTVREAVGNQVYLEIMQRPVPQEILDLLIRLVEENQHAHSYIHLSDISDEIDAGAVEWTQELRRIGVRHPDYLRAYVAAKANVLDRYTSYLVAYATYREVSYDPKSGGGCMRMIGAEWGIVNAVERNVEEEYGREMACLLGLLWEEITTDKILDDLETRYAQQDRSRKPFLRPTPEQRFEEIVPWFLQTFAPEYAEELINILPHLYERFEQLPVVKPLVPESVE